MGPRLFLTEPGEERGLPRHGSTRWLWKDQIVREAACGNNPAAFK